MKIEVKSEEVNTKTGFAKASGKPYSIREQFAYLHVPGDAYPVKCSLQLEDEQAPYPVGLYETTNELYVGDFGRLNVSRKMQLLPQRKAA